MGRSPGKLEREVAALVDLPRCDLAAMWLKTHGCAPPKGVKRSLLERSAAWHLQAKRLGGFSTETRRMLRSAIEAADRKIADRHDPVADATGAAAASTSAGSGKVAAPIGSGPDRKRRDVLPGARLLREWNGRTHVVDVIEGGYVFEAKVYPSLSAIARLITGAHWSGPRFFGLAGR